jgi:hypothetical protein
MFRLQAVAVGHRVWGRATGDSVSVVALGAGAQCVGRAAIASAVFLLALALPDVAAWGQVRISEPFAGVTHIQRSWNAPRQVSVNMLLIDLEAPQLGFRLTPSNGSLPGDTTTQTTRQFLNQQGAQIAINASFARTSDATVAWPYRQVRGLAASDGDVYARFDDDRPYPTINISRDNQVSFAERDPAAGLPSILTLPRLDLFNAVSGSDWILRDGELFSHGVTLGQPTQIHPRTVAGLTYDNRLVLLTVDSGQDGVRGGKTLAEVGDLLKQYNVQHAINLDGGGSTTMVFGDAPSGRVINNPSNSGGAERSNATNLAVFAGASQRQSDIMVFTDFYGGDAQTFNLRPGWSGSTRGIIDSASFNDVLRDESAQLGGWSQRLTITNDPAAGAGSEHDGGWFVRHNSGSQATQSQNVPRETTGFVGFWARTETEGISVSLAIDNYLNVTADRGIRQTMIADGQWHLYEWSLENNDHWEAWVNGNGLIEGDTFTLDSIQFFGPNANAVIWIDAVAHNAFGSLRELVAIPEPSTLWLAGAGLGALALLRRRRRQRLVDQAC